MSDLSGDAAWKTWQVLREEKPLVQCITNFVSMDIMANVLLAAGASPAMVHAVEEVEEFVPKVSALVINVGTLSKEWVQSMTLSARQATRLGKVWVLDPVGAGATTYRTEPTLLRGNASEIMALAGASGTGKGVDSTAKTQDALEAGKQLATLHKTVVAITGEVDLVTNGFEVIEVHNGNALMSKITAAGCSVTAVAAAFITAASDNVPYAAAFALGIFGLAAEKAAQTAKGPASLRTGMIDFLFSLSQKEVQAGLRLQTWKPCEPGSDFDVHE